MSVDNYHKIRPLLEFRSKDDFYFMQILQRKKDHNAGKVNGSNNNSRLIRAYYISSMGYFDFIEKEVKGLCDLFGARAGINLNRRSFEKTSLQLLRKVTDQILNKDFHHTHRAFNSVAGMYMNESDKRWILDVDDTGRKTNDILLFIDRECQPVGDKFIAFLPSKSGYHLITRPFDVRAFKEAYPDIEIHKNNPTNLYIP